MKDRSVVYKYPGFKDILLFVGAFLFSHFLSAGIVILYGVIRRMAGGTQASLLAFTDGQQAAGYILTFVIVIVLCLVYRHGMIREGVNRNRLKEKFSGFSPVLVVWGFVLILAIGVLIDPLGAVFPESLKKLYEMTDGASTYLMLTMIFAAPVLEEILFRGIVQGDLSNRFRPGGAILLSAVIFAVVHMQVIQSINAFFAGLVLGLIYYRSGSLWNVMLIHMINNAFAIVLGYLLPGDMRLTPLRELVGTDWIYYTIYAVAAALTIVLIVKIILLKNKHYSANIGVWAESAHNEVEGGGDAASVKEDKHGDNSVSGADETVSETENKPEGEEDGEYDPLKPYYDKEKPEDTRF